MACMSGNYIPSSLLNTRTYSTEDVYYTLPWVYDVATGEWDLKHPSGFNPDPNHKTWWLQGDVNLVYMSKVDLTFAWSSNYSWGPTVCTYNVYTNTLSPRTSQGTRPGSSWSLYTYDPVRNRVVVLGGDDGQPNSDQFLTYDFASNTWSALPKSSGPGIIGTVNGSIHYDHTNDVYIVNKRGEIYIFDPKANAWSHMPNTFPGTFKATSGFYHTGLNVMFYYSGIDGYVGDMWAYRYKKVGNVVEETQDLQKKGLEISVKPNPFNMSTTINVECRISNVECRSIEIGIFNLKGQLVDKKSFDIQHSLFNIRNSFHWTPVHQTPGVYLVCLQTGRQKIIKRITLLK
jgi:hypothetical protein